MDRVLVVEDEPSLRADMADYLSVKGFSAQGAATVAEALTHLASQPFHAVILDIGLPDGDGFAILAEIRSRGLDCRVVILTSFGEPDFRVRGLDSGADAYLVKNATLREIEATLRSVLRRQKATTAGEPFAGWTVDRIEWLLIGPNGGAIKLTRSEMTFIVALAENSGQVCGRDDLIRQTSRTVASDGRNLDALVRRLRRKIEDGIDLEAPIRVAYGMGYICSAAIRVKG